MNRYFRVMSCTVALAAGGSVTATTSHADVEIGATAGVHIFSATNEIGVEDAPDATSIRNSVPFGLRLGAFFGDIVGIESEGGVIPSKSRAEPHSLLAFVARVSVVIQFRAVRPENKMVPFVLIGGGVMSLVDNSNASPLITTDNDTMLHAGVGAKYRLTRGLGLRVDARIYLPPSSMDNGFTQDFELLVSIYKEFGRTEPRTDGDGIPPPTTPAVSEASPIQ